MKFHRSIMLASCLALLGGCATALPAGALFTDIQLPVNATAESGGASKMGEAMCTSVLALVATGDCSIEAAAKDGGISTIHHVDWKARNILGIYGEYHVRVYGD